MHGILLCRIARPLMSVDYSDAAVWAAQFVEAQKVFHAYEVCPPRLGTYSLDYTDSYPSVIVRGCGDRLGYGSNAVVLHSRTQGSNWTPHAVGEHATHIVTFVQLMGTRSSQRSSTENKIISATQGEIYLHDMNTSKRITQRTTTGGVSCSFGVLHPFNYLLEASTSNTIQILDANTLQVVDNSHLRVSKQCNSFCSIPGKDDLFIAGGDEFVNYYDIRKLGEPLHSIHMENRIITGLAANSRRLFATGNVGSDDLLGFVNGYELYDDTEVLIAEEPYMTRGSLQCDEGKLIFMNINKQRLLYFDSDRQKKPFLGSRLCFHKELWLPQ